jgi:DNA-binding FadR family transcriptional regulator
MENPLWKLMRAHNFEFGDRGQRYLKDHRTILDAIRQGSGNAAFRAMHAHISMIGADLEAEETLRQTGMAAGQR